MQSNSFDFLAILRALAEHGVEFIIVGGVSAVLQGAPVSTFDIDLVHRRDPENIHRLLAALGELDAVFRGTGDGVLRPGPAHLSSSGHQLLMTRHGPLDLLGTIGTARGYQELLPHTMEIRIAEFTLRSLDLETIIEIKEELGHDKDRASIPLLRRTLEEISRKSKGE